MGGDGSRVETTTASPVDATHPNWPPRWAPDILSGAEGGFWVFAYGSLIWRPDFPHAERRGAIVHGWHRRLCIASHHYRGTPERPGLVLGLDRGGTCVGVAFRVDAGDVAEALDRLWAREMISGVYRPSWVETRRRPIPAIDEGRAAPNGAEPAVRTLTFVAVRGHPQYCPRLSEEEVAARLARCSGAGGRNLDYLAETAASLRRMGVRDLRLERHLAAARRRDGPTDRDGGVG